MPAPCTLKLCRPTSGSVSTSYSRPIPVILHIRSDPARPASALLHSRLISNYGLPTIGLVSLILKLPVNDWQLALCTAGAAYVTKWATYCIEWTSPARHIHGGSSLLPPAGLYVVNHEDKNIDNTDVCVYDSCLSVPSIFSATEKQTLK